MTLEPADTQTHLGTTFLKTLSNTFKPMTMVLGFILAAPRGMQDLSSPKRDQIQGPALEARSLKPLTIREVPNNGLYSCF